MFIGLSRRHLPPFQRATYPTSAVLVMKAATGWLRSSIWMTVGSPPLALQCAIGVTVYCQPNGTCDAIPRRRSPCASSVSQCRSEEHTSELQSLRHLVCRLLLEKKL